MFCFILGDITQGKAKEEKEKKKKVKPKMEKRKKVTMVGGK